MSVRVQQTAADVQAAEAGDEERVVGTIVTAFVSDPIARWGFPDPHQYLEAWPAFVRAFGGRAFEHHAVHRTADFSGAALWLPPGAEPDEEAIVGVLESSVAPELVPRVGEMLEEMGRRHITESHWYLPLIGVDAARQRSGIGSALLRHALEIVDRDHLPAYLEATSELNVPLYERHGFELQEPIQLADAPPLHPMVRPAR